MQYLLKKEEIERLKEEATPCELVETWERLRPLIYAEDQVNTVLRQRVHKGGGEIELPDGRRAYFRNRPGRRSITDQKAAFERLTEALGNEYWATVEHRPKAIEDAIQKVIKDDKGKPLPKTSSKPDQRTVKTEYNALVGDITHQSVSKILVVEPKE